MPQPLTAILATVLVVVSAAACGYLVGNTENNPAPKPKATGPTPEANLKEPGDKPVRLPRSLRAAGDSVPGCVTRFVVNQSTRSGQPTLFVLHETVSANRPGWSDVDAIVGFFNRPSARASSNFVIDHEGHCAYIVPLSRKAWTQVGFNSVSISVEMIDTATPADGSYADVQGRKKLAQVFWAVQQRYPSIGARIGATSGCSTTRSGIVDHRSLGSCGGGHVDISPWDYKANARYILAHKPLTKRDVAVAACARLNRARANVRKRGYWHAPELARAKKLRATAVGGGVSCPYVGKRYPVK